MIEPADPDLIPPARPPVSPEPAVDAPGDEEAFTVHLDRVFRGPLGLLLQLVRDKEMEIHVVSLAEVCDAYCRHVRAMEQVDVDEAVDYLVLAATLLAIKSRSLLPQEEIEETEDPFDPGEELVRQLLLYKDLRRVADELGEHWRHRRNLLPAGRRWLGRAPDPEEDQREEEDWDLGDISIWDLLGVFQRLEKETGFMRPHRIQEVGKPLSWYVESLWSKLEVAAEINLEELFQEGTRADASYYLVAVLELAKQKALDLAQQEPFGKVVARRVEGMGDIKLDDLDQGFDYPVAAHEPEIEDLLES